MAVTLKISVFPGGANLPLWAGMAQGFFAQHGLTMEPHYTGSSVEQITTLVNGNCDLGLTGFDNIVAYQEGQGEAKLTREPDLFAFMGGDDAFLRFVVQGDIGSYADLKGKTLSVDAMTTGFAFVLREMLKRNGVAESDVTFERAGGALQRFDALKEGRHTGTLLLTPFELSGARFGLKVLQSAKDVVPRYQGIVGVASRGWAKAHQAELEGFIAGYLKALRWLFDKANREAAVALLTKHIPGMPAALAAGACEVFLAEQGGFDPAARMDPEGVKAGLALRSEYGRPQKRLDEPARYQDLSYYERALEQVT